MGGSTWTHCKENINNKSQHWGGILDVLRHCSDNKGNLDISPTDDLFHRIASFQVPCYWLIYLWSLLISQSLGRSATIILLIRKLRHNEVKYPDYRSHLKPGPVSAYLLLFMLLTLLPLPHLLSSNSLSSSLLGSTSQILPCPCLPCFNTHAHKREFPYPKWAKKGWTWLYPSWKQYSILSLHVGWKMTWCLENNESSSDLTATKPSSQGPSPPKVDESYIHIFYMRKWSTMICSMWQG
jgi:hypothetical protein